MDTFKELIYTIIDRTSHILVGLWALLIGIAFGVASVKPNPFYQQESVIPTAMFSPESFNLFVLIALFVFVILMLARTSRWLLVTGSVAVVVGGFVGVLLTDTPPFDLLPGIMRGIDETLLMTVLGTLLALVVAVVTGIARTSHIRLIRFITGMYVEVFRGTSVLVQLFWIYFVLPLEPFNITISALEAGVLALGLNVGAYGAEVVRGAIQAVPRGQIEAATALNMPPLMQMRRVILPQALVRIIPPFGNLMIELLKATSLASLITLSDITFQARSLQRTQGRVLELYGLLLLMYFLIAYPLVRLMRWLENRRQWA